MHRGPDDEGYLFYNVEENTLRAHGIGGGASSIFSVGDTQRSSCSGTARAVALGHRRLSIIDLSSAAHQPMELAEGRMFIVFNGEIYNYRELRQELEALGRRFDSKSDTEVVLAAYAQWGARCLPRLIGMFAFAILDTSAHKLFLARDFFGIKPLYYALCENGFLFSSEIPALLSVVPACRKANLRRVFEFLNWGHADYGNETFFQAIRQLPAAHYLEISLDQATSPTVAQYWDVERHRHLAISFEDAAEQLRSLFLESVRLHLRSDVPLGVALSGGIDSSAIASCVRHLLGKDAELHSFSYIADDLSISEERWVDAVNTACRAVPHKFHLHPSEVASELEALIEIQGEPFSSPVVYAQYRVFRYARENGIKVLLEGQGADELLAGYPMYVPALLASLLRSGRGWRCAQLLKAASRNLQTAQPSLLRSAAAALAPPTWRRRVRLLRGEQVHPWISHWLVQQGVTGYRYPRRETCHLLRESLYETLFKTKIPTFVRWGDRNSMACSVENRVPFLTTQLADFLFSLPEEYLLAADGTTKAIFRRAMRDLVPAVVLERKTKIGFMTPYRAWFDALRPRVPEWLRVASEIPAINYAAVEQSCAGFLAGQTASLDFAQDFWRLLMLSLWTRRFDVVFA
jgi:asparagine synthase (glutamine-hydrolysing)